MADSKAALRQREAWELLLSCRLNVRYWRRTLSHRSAVARWVKWSVAGVTFVGALLWWLLEQHWATIVIPASIAFLSAVLGSFVTEALIAKFKRFCERWSDLLSDAEALWRRGEHEGWNTDGVVTELVRLRERERNYHSQEYDEPNRRPLVACEKELWSELGVRYRG